MTVACVLGYASSACAQECALKQARVFRHAEIGAIPIFSDPASRTVLFSSQMQVNTDGAPDSYHPDNIGITHVCNGVSVGPRCEWKASCMGAYRQARAEGFRGATKICFFAMVTGRDGVPIIQGEGDPKSGYFVSTTALKQPGRDVRTAAGQLDSNLVPFAVIPRTWQRSGGGEPKLGDFGVAYRQSTGKMSFFIVGDTGPANKLGEGSVALHRALGNDPFINKAGVVRALKGIGGRDVIYLLFPHSATPGKPIDVTSIERTAGPLFEHFGGIARLKACARASPRK